jgi:RimJ/RimL family protein N-acetyltransferase
VTRPPTYRTDKQGDTFALRGFEPEDRERLERMYDEFEPKRVAQGLPPAGAEQRRRWLDTVLRAGHHLIVEVDGTVLGHGMLLPIDAESGELANFLHQTIRDRGIGTGLNRELLDFARDIGLHRVWLSVEPSNRRAVRSYEKAGFRRRFTSGWAPELEMEIELADAPPP